MGNSPCAAAVSPGPPDLPLDGRWPRMFLQQINKSTYSALKITLSHNRKSPHGFLARTLFKPRHQTTVYCWTNEAAAPAVAAVVVVANTDNEDEHGEARPKLTLGFFANGCAVYMHAL